MKYETADDVSNEWKVFKRPGREELEPVLLIPREYLKPASDINPAAIGGNL